MNKVQLLGRLARDPETKYTSGDKPLAICRFTLCVNRMKDKEGKQETDFISCKALGARAEAIQQFVVKGDRLCITGSWQTGSYKKEDGTTVYTNECLVESIDFLENKKEKDEKNLSVYDSYNESDFSDELPF